MKKTQYQPTDPDPAYSYLRFSSPSQADGNSIRRQTELRDGWLERHPEARLDTSITLHDLGKSAFTGEHRKNPDRYALAAFLRLVEQGRVPRGSYLLVENLDRLSREHIRPALTLLLNLIEAGVRVVQLSPVEAVYDENVDPMQLMQAIMELSRGHSESAMKAERVGKAWKAKRNRLRETGEVLTARLPSWIIQARGRLCLVKHRAATVRRIFELAASGYGTAGTVKRLTADRLSPFGAREEYKDDKGRTRYRAIQGTPLGSGRWTRSNVANILKDRRAIGEFQPRLRDGTPDGTPLPNYYPPVVTEQEWLAARAGAAQRRQRPGRTGKHVNVFAGLVKDARDGGSYYCATRTDSSKHTRVLINTNAAEGRSATASFPFATFERAVLAALREVPLSEVVGTNNKGPDVKAILSRELAGVDAELANATAYMEANGFSSTIGKRVTALEARKRDLLERLTVERQRQASPASEAWGEARSLIEILDTAADPADIRMRLRAAVRRAVESIWLLVVPRGRDRMAAVQIYFQETGRCRNYTILHRPPMSNKSKLRRPGRWWAETWPVAGAVDLRTKKGVAMAERYLTDYDPSCDPEPPAGLFTAPVGEPGPIAWVYGVNREDVIIPIDKKR